MYTRPTAPRPIGGVLDDAVRLYRASFSRCWLLSLGGAVLSAAVGVWQARQMAALPLASISVKNPASLTALATAMARLGRMEHSPMLWLNYFVLMLVWLLFRAAIIRRQDDVASEREESLGEALGHVARHLPEFIVAGIVFLLVTTIGFMILIVPGIWLWGYLQLWLVAAATEDLGPFAALGRSWRLIERHWWRTSATLFVAIVIIVVLGVAGSMFSGIAAVVAHGDLVTILLITQLLSAVINVFTMPMLTAAMVAIFHDLKLRRDGGDLAARVSSLQPA